MEIIITSKHIYDKDNDKVRDNKVDKVEIDGTYITPNASDGGVIHTEEVTFAGEITAPYTIQWFNSETNEMASFTCDIESTHDYNTGGNHEETISVSGVKGGLKKVEFIAALSPNILEFRVVLDNMGIDAVAYVTVNGERTFYSIYKDTTNSNSSYSIFWVNIGILNRYTVDTVSANDATFITHNLYGTDTAGTFSYAIAKAINTKFYCNGVVYVPKNSKNKTITNILSSEEEPKNVITYSSTCAVKICEISKPFDLPFGVKNNGGATTVGNGSYVAYLDTLNIPDISMDDRNFGAATQIDKFERENTTMAPLSVISEASFTDHGTKYAATATATLADETTSSKINVFDMADGSGYIVDFKILVGTGIDILSAVGTKVQFTEIKENTEEEQTIKNVPFKGTSTFYFPQNVSINFFGNTIGIDMNDKTVTINGDGTHPISFEGNELIQTTNYVMENGESKNYITTAFGKTMDLYKNGKETATILCDIHDDAYYNITKNLTYSSKDRTDQYDFYTTEFGDFDEYDDRSKTFRFEVKCTPNSSKIVTTAEPHDAVQYHETIDLKTGMVIIDGITMKENDSVSLHVDCTVPLYNATLDIKADDIEIDWFDWLNGDKDAPTVIINGITMKVPGYNQKTFTAYAHDLTENQFHALQKGVDKLQYKMKKVEKKSFTFSAKAIYEPWTTQQTNTIDKGLMNVKVFANSNEDVITVTLLSYDKDTGEVEIEASCSVYGVINWSYTITGEKELDKIHYEIGDIVIPMVYGANGVDKPMSKYKDGSPKKFQVQGVRVFYDGAVWQELTLQEFS